MEPYTNLWYAVCVKNQKAVKENVGMHVDLSSIQKEKPSSLSD